MAISGWVNGPTDLRDETPIFTAMTTAAGPVPPSPMTVRLGRDAGFCCQGPQTGYADWRHPERPDPDIVVAIEGRLSNREVLLNRLGQRRTHASDADLVLHAYRRWGQFLVEQIDGVYAIAIWDHLRRQLLLVRDPLGVKTWFYYPLRDGSMAFATKSRGLLAHPNVEPAITSDGLNELLVLGPARTPGHAVVNGMHEVLPGHITQTVPGRIRTHRYWQWQAEAPESSINEVEAAAVVRRTLAEATAALRTDPVGAVLLSGGVASASAAALATPHPSAEQRPTAYTMALAGPWGLPPGAGTDVTAAGRVAQHLALDHRLIKADKSDLLDLATATRRILDLPGEPARDAAVFGLLSAATVTGSSVVTGVGADAVFGWVPSLKTAVTDVPWLGYDAGPVALLSAEARMHMLPTAYTKQRFEDAISAIPAAKGVSEAQRAWHRDAYLNLSHRLPAQVRRWDELATAIGMSVHNPLADWLLTQHTLRFPDPIRHLRGMRLGLLRHAISDLLPAGLTWLPGRVFPTATGLPGWRTVQRERMLGLLSDSSQPLQPLLDPAQIRPLLTRAPEHAYGGRSVIAHLIEVNAWLARHQIRVI
ncbi:hypothetical protein JIG36_51110 [Actinoplanes sp. LDG1-06]|uniref:asparagine synthase (glutamine-hydrolyzing) n=1 Tax=Paractinoplanes ovalisporus TaxID=2810368 RepID=A0ABS2AXG0_9ACTN|nr:asparagine synthase-related protein [Actinoplanes ovalisporus]MBM2623869.1 hypothetical protein [Actinoplanes ovalisporus]